MRDRTFRLGAAGKALIAGGLLGLKGSLPTFVVSLGGPAAAPTGQATASDPSQSRTLEGSGGAALGALGSLGSLGSLGLGAALLVRGRRRAGARACGKVLRAEPTERRRPEEEVEEEVAFLDGEACGGKVACAALISSAKSQCVHPERKPPYLCGDCPRNAKTFDEKVCAAAAFVSSAKTQCVHPERKPPYLCGDCPRNGFMKEAQDTPKVCSAAAFVSSVKTQCVHPDRKDPYLCGDCPRAPKFSNL
ncbi:unnamed protein product [Symbiodinium natans]|uniref:Uncharacterized protein n=1 Tax=Symbiodinium natans TaxID=878477 RepID=A0A812JMM2_9DINO|nr:unnamed protein product [Symbiodinium natans]